MLDPRPPPRDIAHRVAPGHLMSAHSDLAAPAARALPSLVVQAGVYRSASTWASNAVAALLRPWGPVRIVFDDVLAPVVLHGERASVGEGERLVVKVHRASPALVEHIRRMTPPVVLTVREPLDCVASMMTQFGEPFARASAAIAQSCHALAPYSERATLLLRYEDHPRDAETVRALAGALCIPAVDADGIAEGLSPARVNAFIAARIADGSFGPNPTVAHSDSETHWHPNHLGSGESHRYLAVLTKAEIAEVARLTAPFRALFGYAAR